MKELFKLLADFLFRKGYLISLGNLGIKIEFNGTQPAGDIRRHGWIRLKQGTDILGLLEPQALLNQGTQDWEWTEIGNIHSPNLLDRLVEELDKRVVYDLKSTLPFRNGDGIPFDPLY